MEEETIKLLKDAVLFEREELANDILAEAGHDSINNDVFNKILQLITMYDKKQYKQIHAFELQKVHDEVIYGRLQYEYVDPKQITIFDEINSANKS